MLNNYYVGRAIARGVDWLEANVRFFRSNCGNTISTLSPPSQQPYSGVQMACRSSESGDESAHIPSSSSVKEEAGVMPDCDASIAVRYLSLDTFHRTLLERTQSRLHTIWSPSHSPPRQHRRPAATSTDCTLESALFHVTCSSSEVNVDNLFRPITDPHSPPSFSIDDTHLLESRIASEP